MKLLLAVFSLLVATYAASINGICDGVRYKGQYYEEILLKTGLDRPFLLAVDHETDTLYFNYNVAPFGYKSAGLNLKTKEFKDIDGIPNGFSHAVDSDKRLLYVGTTDGIYVYNLETKQSNFLGAKGQFIWTLFFKDDVLYYCEYPSQHFYTFSNGIVQKFKDLEHSKVHLFLLDYDNDMFFTNGTGLYKQVKGSTDAVFYKSFGHWDVRALTLDLYGNVYAGVKDGVYKVWRHEAKMENILPVDKLFGLAFDADNDIIYSNKTSVVQLKQDKNKNC